MRALFRHLLLPFYRVWALRHIRREREFSHAGLHLSVPVGVFHPGIFFSTPIFLSFLQHIDFQGKNVLDIGTGSGILALFAARGGARATAIDINPAAVKATLLNARKNDLEIRALQSDLFENLPQQPFDIILINPPYYPRRPVDDAGFAFFAGEHFEYFDRLFGGLHTFTHEHSRVWMILSEDCDFEQIAAIARRRGFEIEPVYERKKWGERFFVADVRLVF
ncbi:MAG: methyltransferase [Lewinellaceae bacterium]|nr:methyltransferase [Lewinellaceae bacterium]